MKKVMFCAVVALLSFVSVASKAKTDDAFTSTAVTVLCVYEEDGAWLPISPTAIDAFCAGTAHYCGFCYDTTAPAAYDTEAEARAVYLSFPAGSQTEGANIFINGVDTKIKPYYRNAQ